MVELTVYGIFHCYIDRYGEDYDEELIRTHLYFKEEDACKKRDEMNSACNFRMFGVEFYQVHPVVIK